MPPDEIKYPCLMQATGMCAVIVNMTEYGVGAVVGGGNSTGREKYNIGHYSATWQMPVFKPFKA